jgi:hypothetical protein
VTATLQEKLDTGGSDGNPANQDVIDALGPPRIKFKTADNKTIDNVNPIPKPAAGTNYSFWKSIYLRCSVAPSSQCDNFKYYTDGGGFGTGIALKIGTQHPVKTSISNAGYEVATGTIGETGNEMVAGHAGLSASSDLFGYTSAAPKSVTCGEAGNIINAIGETTNYILLQAEVINTASAGTPSNETFTWKWDEI